MASRAPLGSTDSTDQETFRIVLSDETGEEQSSGPPEEFMDEDFSGTCQPTNYFDKVVGILEEVVVGDDFQTLQNFYLTRYWEDFGKDYGQTSTDHTYHHFQIFKDYSQEMSNLLEIRLKKSIPEFNMEEFIRSEVGPRTTNIPEETSEVVQNDIFEMLFTLVDFVKFRELLVDYRKVMEGKSPNLTVGATLLSPPQ